MKFFLPITFFLSSTMTAASTTDSQGGLAEGQQLGERPRHLRNAKPEAPHGRPDRVGDPRSGGTGVTHFNLSHGKKPASQHSGNHDYGTLIVGGDDSRLGEFPYYVDLTICGGSLIAPGVVLSAAHCGEFDGQQVTVGAYRPGNSNTAGASSRTVSESRLHPNYDEESLANDFSLLRLSSPVTLSSTTKLVINQETANPRDNDPLTVLGLGTLTEGGSTPNVLQDVEVFAVDIPECNEAYGNVDGEVMFCAGVDGGGKDSCQGDSGGPIVDVEGNNHIQVGVVSWGFGCARPGVPGVYARVSSAVDWIKQVVCDEWNESADFCDGNGPNPTPPGPSPTPPGPSPTPNPTPSQVFTPGPTPTQVFTPGPTPTSTFGTPGPTPTSTFGTPGPTPQFQFSPGPTPQFTPGPTPSSGNNGPSGCVDLLLEVRTDDFGDDTDFFLVDERGNFIWNEWGFDDNARYNYIACIDPRGCNTLDFFDWFGDGIQDPGFLKVTYDGNVQFNSGDIGGGEVFRFGTGC